MYLWPDEVFNIETVLAFMNYSAALSRAVVYLTQSMGELLGVVALRVATD